MAEHLIWYLGNRDPSITETIEVDGSPVDLTGKTVRFKMRAVGDDTTTVDAAATVMTPAAGTVRYDWLAGDVDTAGFYLIWWEVTSGTKTQDVGEAIIEIRSHAGIANGYIELEQLKSTLQLTGDTFADADIQSAIAAASQSIDSYCNRRFYPDADASQVRYYTPVSREVIYVDDVLTLTTLKTDADGDGTFETTWTLNTDFGLEPMNAAGAGQPYGHIRRNPRSSKRFYPYPRSVEVTGKFGWDTPPASVVQAATIFSSRLLKRAREVPFGVMTAGLDGGATRIPQLDPDMRQLLSPWVRGPFIR